MGNAITRNYDALIFLSEAELERMFHSLLLESDESAGGFSFRSGTPLYVDATVDGSRVIGWLHPPVVRVTGPDSLMLEFWIDHLRVYAAGAESVLPISDDGAYLEMPLTIGYPADGPLSLIPGKVLLQKPGTFEDVEIAPAGAPLPLPLEGGACPLPASSMPDAVRTPSFDDPAVACVDFATVEGAGERSGLVLAAKMSAAPVARGSGGAGELDIAFRNERASFALSNEFLLEEALPPGLIDGLIRAKIENQVVADGVPEDQRAGVVGQRVAAQRAVLAAEHFLVRPFEILKPFRMHAALPLEEEGSTRENFEIRGVKMSVDAGRGAVVLEVDCAGEHDLYRFEGTVKIAARAVARAGAISTDAMLLERAITVLPPWGSDVISAIAAGVSAGSIAGTIAGAIIGAIIGAFAAGPAGAVEGAVIGGFVGFFAGAALGGVLTAGAIAAASAVASLAPVTLGDELGGGAGGPALLPVWTDDVTLDDLLVKGRLAPAEIVQVDFEGATRVDQPVWNLWLDGDRAAMPTAGPWVDAVVGALDRADVRLTGGRLEAINGSLASFGAMPMHQALALRQYDVRHAAYARDVLDVNALLPADAGTIDPQKMAEKPDRVVVPVAVLSRRGRPALLILWRDGGVLRAYYRRYRQTPHGVTVSGYKQTRWVTQIEASDTINVPADFGAYGVVDVPVTVGWKVLRGLTTGGFVAKLWLVRHPVTVEWVVIDRAGMRTALVRGDNVIRIDASDVLFTVEGFLGTACGFVAGGGASGAFVIEATVTERDVADPRTFVAWTSMSYDGSRTESIGFRDVARLLSAEFTRKLGGELPEVDRLLGGDPEFTDPSPIDDPDSEWPPRKGGSGPPPKPPAPGSRGAARRSRAGSVLTRGEIIRRVAKVIHSLPPGSLDDPSLTPALERLFLGCAGLPDEPDPGPPDPPSRAKASR